MTQKKWRRNKEQKKKDLLDATRNLLKKKVYYEITTKEIAKRAGVSIGLLYKYYPDGKESLINSLAEDFAKRSLEPYSTESDQLKFPDKVDDIRDFIYTNMRRTIQMHRENKDLNLALEMIYLSNPDVETYALDNYETYNNDIADVFITFVANQMGGIHIDKSFSRFLVQTVDATIHRHVTLFPIANTDEELTEMLTKMVIDLISSNKRSENKN